MASSLEFNKLIAGVLTAGIIASASGLVASLLYQPHAPEENAYKIDVESGAETADEGGDETPSIAVRLASADAGAGEAITRQCTACHTFDEGGANRVGPHLWDVVGRDIASADGFAYSDALAGLEGDWTYEKLDGFLESPRDWAPGTAMSYAGLRDAGDRADLILYLHSLSNDPLPLPEPEEAATAEAEAGDDAAASDETAEAPAEEPATTEETAEAPAEEPAAAEETAEAPAEEPAAAEETAEAPAEEPAATEETAEAPAEEAAAAEETAEAPAEEAAAAEETAEAPADEEPAATEETAEASPMVAMVADTDPASGERPFRQCAACHSAEEGGGNRVGPALWGVFGRNIASADGFSYSDALESLEGEWTVDKLDGYLANPREYAPGNRMAFAGVRKEEDRAALIAYLHSLSNDPVPLD